MENRQNVISFPGLSEKSWHEVETTLRNVFVKYGYGKADVAEHIIKKIEGIYFTHCKAEVTVTLPAEVSPDLGYELSRQINKHYSDIIAKLAMEVVLKEIELYHLKEDK